MENNDVSKPADETNEAALEIVASFAAVLRQAPDVLNNEEFCGANRRLIEALQNDATSPSVKASICKAALAIFNKEVEEARAARANALVKKRIKTARNAKLALGVLSLAALFAGVFKGMESVALAAFGALVGLLAPDVLNAVARFIKIQK